MSERVCVADKKMGRAEPRGPRASGAAKGTEKGCQQCRGKPRERDA